MYRTLPPPLIPKCLMISTLNLSTSDHQACSPIMSRLRLCCLPYSPHLLPRCTAVAMQCTLSCSSNGAQMRPPSLHRWSAANFTTYHSSLAGMLRYQRYHDHLCKRVRRVVHHCNRHDRHQLSGETALRGPAGEMQIDQMHLQQSRRVELLLYALPFWHLSSPTLLELQGQGCLSPDNQ